MNNVKPILDPCCGSKMFWFDKQNPSVTFCDIRDVDRHEYYPGRYIEIKPDIQCDFRHLPFENNVFWHVVFDPPHLNRVGKTSWTREKYGALDATWPQMLHDGFAECWRVLKPNGTLIFKWSSVQIPLSDVLKAIGHTPLYGHKSGKHMQTHWLAFVKLEQQDKDAVQDLERFKRRQR